MPVDEELARMLAKTLEQTDALLERNEITWDVAIRGVEAIATDLERRYPAHAAWIRERIANWIRRRAH